MLQTKMLMFFAVLSLTGPSKTESVVASRIAIEEVGDTWRRELLSGVDSLPKHGAPPGTIVVYGENAHGIFAGKAVSDLIGAAAQLGSGRVLAFAHTVYSSKFIAWARDPDSIRANYARFWSNAYKWLLNGQNTDQAAADVTIDINGRQSLTAGDLDGKRIAIWTGSTPKSREFVETLTSFVSTGGSVVCGLTPWVITHGLEDFAMNTFVQQSGLIYTSESATAVDPIPLENNPASQAHVRLNLLKLLESDANVSDTQAKAIMYGLRFVPLSGISDLNEALTAIYPNLSAKIYSAPGAIDKPVRTVQSRMVMSIGYFLHMTELQRKNENGETGVHVPKLPGTDLFPGTFPPEAQPELTTVVVKVKSPFYDSYSTGLYAVPGVDVKISVLYMTGASSGSWSVRVGSHTDSYARSVKVFRWPDISVLKRLETNETVIRNPFGGLIYVYSPSGPNEIALSISNVIRSPRVDITDPNSVAQWNVRKQAPGLWADLCGRFVTFTVPSESIRDLDDPVPILEFWDRVIAAHHDLKGTNINKERKQWVVYDFLTNGGLHSGYPIIADMWFTIKARFQEIPEFPLNYEQREKRVWGITHEMGHNMQDSRWTFEGTREVTNNVFVIHALERLMGIPAWHRKWYEGSAGYLNGEPSFAKWLKQSDTLKLGVYMQLAHHFGWSSYQRVFRKYNEMGKVDSATQALVDLWISTFSKAVGYNIYPLYDFWGFAGSDVSVEGLPPFFPDDEATRLAPARVEYILEKYPNVVRNVSAPENETPYIPAIGPPVGVEPPFVALLEPTDADFA